MYPFTLIFLMYKPNQELNKASIHSYLRVGLPDTTGKCSLQAVSGHLRSERECSLTLLPERVSVLTLVCVLVICYVR